MRIKGFWVCTQFMCLKNSHGCELIKMCLHIQSRHCFRLFSFSFDFIYKSPLLSHFCSPWTHLFMFTMTIFLFWQIRIIWRITKTRTKKEIWSLFLLPCSHLYHLFQIRNTWSNPANHWEVYRTKCCLGKWRFVEFIKLLIQNMLLFISFW